MSSQLFDFDLPKDLEASEPPEAHGLARDEVRLMVSYRGNNRIEHSRFREIGRFLAPGDLLVINTSGTLNAALNALGADGTKLELHLSTRLPDGMWSVELRLPQDSTTKPFLAAKPNDEFILPDGASIGLIEPLARARIEAQPGFSRSGVRLWRARLSVPCPINEYLARHGFPIRYGYVPKQWPADYYQTIFATEAGSAEMPSAGRAFTTELVTGLIARGIQFAPLILHTGVASLEDHEPPYAEYYRVPEETARTANVARASGKRVIAVGTTVIRALETVSDANGWIHPGEGWTEVIVTPLSGVRAVDGLLTGFHEPRATHLSMLQALAGQRECEDLQAGSVTESELRSCLEVAGLEHLRLAYAEALKEKYLWHEFGDLHLILPEPGST